MINAPSDCARCPRLCESRLHVVNGSGPEDATILILGEAPNAKDDRRRDELRGAIRGWAWGRLQTLIKDHLGVDPATVRRENIVRCRPPPGIKRDKPTLPTEREACSEYLKAFLKQGKVKTIITLGDAPLRWFDNSQRISSAHGKPFQWVEEDISLTVVPMYHPEIAHPLRNPSMVAPILADWKRLAELRAGKGEGELGDYAGATEADVIKLLKNVKRFAFDFETTDPRWQKTFSPIRCTPIGFSVCTVEGEAIYLETTNIECLREFLEDPEVEVVAHNAIFEYLVAKGQGITITNLHDAKLLAYVLRRPSTQLKDLSWAELGIRQTRFEAVDWENLDAVIDYGSADSDLEMRLFTKLFAEVQTEDFGALYEMERRLIPILGEMQWRGIPFTPAPCEELGRRLMRGKEILAAKIYTAMGCDGFDVNLNSGTQMRMLLYGPARIRILQNKELKGRLTHDENCNRKCSDHACVGGVRTGARNDISFFPPGLEWPVVAYTKAGDPATDMDTIRHPEYRGEPIVFNLVLLKSITHALNNNITRLPQLVHEDGRIHPAFHQAGQWEEKPGAAQEGADTQRFTSSGPNLQNITHHGDSERPYMAKWAGDLRKSFMAGVYDGVPWKLMTSDAGQEEPRVGAYVSGEALLLEELSGKGDVYCPVATQVYGREITKRDPEERQIGKRNFMGWLNGAGHEGIRTAAYWLTPAEGQAVVDFLSNKYVNIESKRSSLVDNLYEFGYTETLFGFRVYRPAIWAGAGSARNHAERSVMPDLIQGTAAGVMKVWLWKVYEAIQARNISAHILLTIHDEMVFEVHPDAVAELATLCQEMMDGIIPVFIPAECNVGKNWTEMEEVK